MNLEEIKNIKFYCDDLYKDVTIRDYLVKLLEKLWIEQECFNGKRPFGNSGWESDLMKPLIECGAIDGTLDEDGYIEDCDNKKGDEIILEIIKSLK